MIETVATYALGKAVDYSIESFGTKLIHKCQTRRAKNFFTTFVETLCEGEESEAKALAMLDEILASESKSDVLFEAYRAVALARSKNIGPRAIGLLTAQIIGENRDATRDEVLWLEAYESLLDIELYQLFGYYEDAFAGRLFKYSRQGGNVTIKYDQRSDSSPFDFQSEIGSWARKLHTLGILGTERTDKIDVGGTPINSDNPRRSIVDYVVLKEKHERFFRLIDKASPSDLNPETNDNE